MKAVILTAGVGSRIRPLTDTTPKPLLPLGGGTIMGHMLTNLSKAGIAEYVVVTGYMADTIKNYIATNFPTLSVTYVHNEVYENTNTGYSMMLTKPHTYGHEFIKCDGDVAFEYAVIEKLITNPAPNCLTVDTTIDLAAEEVKVTVDAEKKIVAVGKKLDPTTAYAESIGIEKLGDEAGKAFLDELERLMKDPAHHKDYYDDSYTTLVAKGYPFHAVDITGLKWVEIDTHADYDQAKQLFG